MFNIRKEEIFSDQFSAQYYVPHSQVALPLALMTKQRVTNFYDVMDAAYDSEIIREHSKQLGHVPLIDYNHRGPNDERQFDPHEKGCSSFGTTPSLLIDKYSGINIFGG